MQQQDRTEQRETSEETARISEESAQGDRGEPMEVKAIEEAEEDISDDEERADLEASEDEEAAVETLEKPTEKRRGGRFDWPALIAALAIAAFFALTARFNSQPAPSYIPAAVFSAAGCGLLVTAIRKLRARPGVGLLEAGLAGLGMALLQFGVAFTYPDVFSTIVDFPEYGRAFLLTWGLVALFAVVLSLAGATIGHLMFAPRPSSERASKQDEMAEESEDSAEMAEDAEDEDALLSQTSGHKTDESIPFAETVAEDAPELASFEEEKADIALSKQEDAPESTPDEANEDDIALSEEEEEEDAEDEEEGAVEGQSVLAGNRPQRSLLNSIITVLLLGLLPMMAGYVFAASYDFLMNTLNVNSISPAFYPTLSLLSGLLPWRLAAPISLSNSNKSFIVFTLLWRIPDSALGNPNLLDVQALETLVFSATGLALLMIAVHGRGAGGKLRPPASWGSLLLLEALFGLILILPADLWLLRGLEGVLQIQQLLAQLPTLQLLNPTLFVLNLLTGILFCLIVSLIVRRQYQLWTLPRQKNAPLEAKEEIQDE